MVNQPSQITNPVAHQSNASRPVDQPQRSNIFFRLLIVAVALFVMTILALAATLFSNSDAPVRHFLNEFGGLLIAGEVMVSLFLGLTALAVDRRRIVENLIREQAGEIGKRPADENRSANVESQPAGEP